MAVRRFETPPGKQAQVDWGHLGSLQMNGEEHKLWGFAFTLGYSRTMMAEAALDQKLGTLLRMHEEAFRQRLDRRMRVYLAPKVLIIDEMGYLPLDDMGATIFFQLVSARYERGSIILTSNKSYGDWGSIFGDPIIATAILDRLLHHSTTINRRCESYRLKDRRKAGLFPRADQDSGRSAPFLSPDSLQNGPRRQGSASPRKTSAPLTAPGRSTESN